MKLNDLITARRIILSHKDEKMSSFLAYKLMKIIKASDEEENFYKEKLQALIDEYSIKDENGNVKVQDDGVAIAPAHVEAFNKAAAEIQNMEVEAPKIKFSVHELGTIKLTVSEIYALDEFIEE